MAATPRSGLLEVRTALIVLAALACASIIGVLTFLTVGNTAAAALAGVFTLGGSVARLNKLVR